MIKTLKHDGPTLVEKLGQWMKKTFEHFEVYRLINQSWVFWKKTTFSLANKSNLKPPPFSKIIKNTKILTLLIVSESNQVLKTIFRERGLWQTTCINLLKFPNLTIAKNFVKKWKDVNCWYPSQLQLLLQAKSHSFKMSKSKMIVKWSILKIISLKFWKLKTSKFLNL